MKDYCYFYEFIDDVVVKELRAILKYQRSLKNSHEYDVNLIKAIERVLKEYKCK